MNKGTILTILSVMVFTIALICAKQMEQLKSLIETVRAKTPEQEQPPIQTVREKEGVKMLVTAYCPCEKCCGQYADGKTSRGRNAWKTFGVAADPKMLPYNTKLVIPGVGIRIVDDTGGAMRQSAKKGIYHIDVRFHSHKEALEFGREWLDVAVLGPAK